MVLLFVMSFAFGILLAAISSQDKGRANGASRSRRRRSKSVLGSLIASQIRTGRRINRRGGVMCGPGGCSTGGGRRRL